MSVRATSWVTVAMLSAVGALTATATSAQEQPTYRFDLPSQPLADALRAIARLTGVNVLFESKDLKGIRVPELKGQLTAAEAIERALTGTKLQAERMTPTTVVVQPASAASVSGSSDAVTGSVPVAQGGMIRLAQADTSARQVGGASPTLEPQEDGSPSVSGVIQEVTVTATKRTERLQDVPMSIGIITADDINRRALVNSEDYLRGIPGVNQTGDFLGQSIVIRGLETSPASQNSQSGTTVATYFGESPTTNSAGAAGNTGVDIKLVDIERVEVLRGPQGTAFGSSSLGGVVRTIPVAPTLDTFEGRVAAGYSQTAGEGSGNYMGQGVLNIPVVEGKVAVRAVGYRFEDSGFYRNVAGSDPATQATAAAVGAIPSAVNSDDIGASRAYGGRLSALMQVTEDLKFTLNYLNQTTQLDGTPVANRPGYAQTFLQMAPKHVQRGERTALTDTDIELFNAVLEQDFGWASLLGTYTRTKSGTTRAESYSIFPGFYPSLPFGHAEDSPHREQNAEVRLTTQFQGAWNALLGVYAEEHKDSDFHEFTWYGNPATNVFDPGRTDVANFRFNAKLEQIAAFGEVSWKPVPKVTLTAGVRAYDYSRSTHSHNEGSPAFVPGRLSINDRDADASGTTLRGNLSYKPTEDTLVYGGYAQGFRLGSPRQGLPEGLCDLNSDGLVDNTNITMESTRETKADEVDSYEIGGKAFAFNRRLQIDAAVYRIDWTGLPVYSVAPCVRPQNYLINAGKARSEGIELQLSAYLTRSLRIDAGFSAVDARFIQDVPALAVTADTQLPGSPDRNANLGLEYGFDLGRNVISLRADGIYVGAFYGDPAKSETTKAGDYVKLDLSGRAIIGNVNIDVYVRNALNQDDFTFRFIYPGMGEDYGYRMRPRTVGMQVGYRF